MVEKTRLHHFKPLKVMSKIPPEQKGGKEKFIAQSPEDSAGGIDVVLSVDKQRDVRCFPKMEDHASSSLKGNRLRATLQ